MEVVELVRKCEQELSKEFDKVDRLCEYNSLKVLNAFNKCKVSESDFNGTTGYGYDDAGRDKIEDIFSNILGGEDSLVRSQIISGTHAISTALFGILRPNDTILSISGKPYDTLEEVIGIKENASSLKSFGINYKQIDLVDSDFAYDKIVSFLNKHNVKVVYIQRSRGYSLRRSICIDKIKKVVELVKRINKDIIIMVDNCYCEFVEKKTPLEVGADIIIGSLIKNLGGGIAPNGGYICGKKELIHLCSERLNVAGEAKLVGPSMNMNKLFLQGIYMAPSVVASALKTAILTSKVLSELGYNVSPKYNEKRVDIVESIIFKDKDKLIKYCQGIQSASAIDSNVAPIPYAMPGYSDSIIMSSGSFIQGSSIEISCDGPIKEPYVAYQQGGLTYHYGKIALIKALNNILKK